jgi:hypothetical protein
MPPGTLTSPIHDAPVLTRQFQEAVEIGLLGRQTGDDPDRLDFLSPTL